MEKVFSFNEPAFEITKSYRDTSGQMFLEGQASTIGIDETGERMSPEVIAKMAARLVGKPLRDEHEKGWYDKLGEIVKADVIKDKDGKPALWIKAKLHDWNSKARDLFNLLKNTTEKMGLSVAGHINPGGIVKQFVESVGKYIPTYVDVDPTEVSVTDHPANLDTFAYAVAKSMNIDESSKEEITKVIPVNTDTDGKGVNNMNKEKLTSKAVSSDVATFIKDWNPAMSAEMGGELKKVEKATEDKVVEKTDVVKTEEKQVEKKEEAKKEEVKTEAEKAKVEETKTEAEKKADDKTETEKKVETKAEKAKEDTSSSLDGILKDLAETLSSLKTGLSSADEEKKKTEKKAVETKTDEDEVDKACKSIEEALKTLKSLGKTKKADDSQSSSTVTETEKAEKKEEKKMEQGSDFTTEKKLNEVSDTLAKVQKALLDLNEKVEKIPNMRKGKAMVVEKNLGGQEEDVEVKKSTEDFKDPFVAGRKTDMYKKMMADPEVTFQDMQKYLNAGIIPAKYNKLDAKDEMKKKLLEDKNVSFQEAHRALNLEASKK